MSDLLDFLEFIDYTNRHEKGVKSDPFTKFSVEEFKSRYNFRPQVVKNVILPLVEADLQKSGAPVAPEIMLLVTLRYFATCSFQNLDEDISKQDAVWIVTTVSELLASKMKDFVKFPSSEEELSKVKKTFYKTAKIPGIIGCIGCTVIKKVPNQNGFTIKVQAVTGPNLEFYDIYINESPDCNTDNSIYNNSPVKERLVTGELSGILLGHSGYTVSKVLLTPIVPPKTKSEELYNKCLMKTRNTGKSFTIWKERFSCLKEDGEFVINISDKSKIDMFKTVIYACAMLHNIAIKFEDTKDCEDDVNGILFREGIVNRFFSCKD